MYQLVTDGHPVLKQRADEVNFEDMRLPTLCKELEHRSVMYGLLGISANQLGVPMRVAFIRTKNLRTVMINPEIVKSAGPKKPSKEFCVSYRELGQVETMRSSTIWVRYYALEKGEIRPYEKKLQKVEAAVVQHEIDHLNGIVLKDFV